MGEEHLIPLSPSKTGNKRVQEYDDNYELGTESDESDEYSNPPKGYSVSTGKENSPRKGRSRKKRKCVGKKQDNKDSIHGAEKKPAAAPRPRRTPSMTSQSARAPVTELEGTAGVTNVGHGHDNDADVDATTRQPAVTFGQVTTIEVT
jgi:hypothetical protein